MLIVTINSVLERAGKSIYWLAKETDLNYAHLIKVCNNQTTMISFDAIEKICNALDCTPNDILRLND